MPERFKIRKVTTSTWESANEGIEGWVSYSGTGVESDVEVRANLLSSLLADPYRGEEFTEKYVLYTDISEVRDECFIKIDRRSDQLIAAGFTFEGIVFSMSMEAQARYLDMKVDPLTYPYPLPINSLDDKSVLYLQNAIQTRAFCNAAKIHILTVVGSGSAQKQAVRDSDDWDFLRNYEDPRPLPENIPVEPGAGGLLGLGGGLLGL